jgi:hypothetical protein
MDSQVKSHLRNLNNTAYFNLKCGILMEAAKNKTTERSQLFVTPTTLYKDMFTGVIDYRLKQTEKAETFDPALFSDDNEMASTS